VSSLVEKISEEVAIFVFSLLASFIRPLSMLRRYRCIRNASIRVPTCTDPTHSILSETTCQHLE
ncbi:hypothetical protein V8E54_012429, partial [Elaphomyces granulatus]